MGRKGEKRIIVIGRRTTARSSAMLISAPKTLYLISLWTLSHVFSFQLSVPSHSLPHTTRIFTLRNDIDGDELNEDNNEYLLLNGNCQRQQVSSAQTDNNNPMWKQDAYLQRFSSIGRLYEVDTNISVQNNLSRLANATVAIFGVGGVGSWTAEALVRSGIGNLIICDLDDICVSNTNRQIHTTTSTVGKFKVDVMKQRLQDISPTCNITCIHDFVR